MKVGVYGFDRGPDAMFKLIAKAIKERGHELIPMLPPQTIPSEEFIEACRSADVLLVNFSALQIAEVEFLEKVGDSVPFVVVEDLYAAVFRPHAKHLAQKAAGAILAFGFQAQDAEAFGYAKNKIFYVGPPAHWKDGYLRLRDSADQRLAMNIKRGSEVFPVKEDNFIVFYAGSKWPEQNNNILSLFN